MSLEFVLMLLLVLATAYNALEARRGHVADRQRDRVLARVDAFLTVWAQTWGLPAEDVRQRLQQVLGQYPA